MESPPLLEYPSHRKSVLPLGGKAKAAIIALIVSAVFLALFAGYNTWAAFSGNLYRPVPGGPPVVPSGPQFLILMVNGGIACCYLLAFTVAAVFFCLWIYRAMANLHAMGISRLRTTPGWAVGFWFIPIMNWYKPLQILKEMWQASSAEEVPGTIWETNSVSILIWLWWSMWVLNSFLGVVNYIIAQTNPSYAAGDGPPIINCVAMIPNLLSAVFIIMIVRQLTDRIENKARTIQDIAPAA